MNGGQDCGYTGRLLRVDLDQMKVETENIAREVREGYVGGTGFGAFYLYKEVPEGVEWSDPENVLVISSGPLGGTRFPGSGTTSIVTKGPMTNMAGSSQLNGHLGAYLRFCGYDGIILRGKAKKLLYLFVDEERVELRDASTLRGKDTFETEDILRMEMKESERAISVYCIGPAGENLVKFAVIVGDKGHVASKNGVGAVMGSKNVKAIVVKNGNGRVNIYDKARFDEAVKANIASANKLWGEFIYKYGTAGAVPLFNNLGVLPVRNYTTNIFPDFGKIGGEFIRTHYETKPKPCYRCPTPHIHTMRIKNGRYSGFMGEEPDYEAVAAWGPLIGQSNIEEIVILNNLTDRLGLDVNECGWLFSWAMECYEKGMLSERDTGGLRLNWGNVEAVKELLLRIAHRQGFGDLMAEGVKRASERMGKDASEMAVYTLKGATPRGHDHRARWRELVDTCFSNTSTIEATFAAHPSILAPPEKDPFSLDSVIQTNGRINGWRQFDDSLGICRFCEGDALELLNCLNSATGWNLKVDDAMRIGRKIINLLRSFNIRHGLTKSLEYPSVRYGSIPVDGPAQGKNIMSNWEEMQTTYYTLMGWDEETGRPLPNTLKDLGLDWVVSDLWKNS